MSWLSLLALLPLLPEVPVAAEGEAAVAAEGEAAVAAEGEAAASEPTAAERWRAPYLGVQVDLYSTYVFRGTAQYGSPVIPSFQPSVWLDFSHLIPGDLTFTVWSAWAMADRELVRRRGGTEGEVDVVLAYETSVLRGWLELGGGFLYYVYPGQEEADGEKELSLSLGVGNLPISIGVTAYLEVHPGFGVQIEPTIGFERSFGDFSVGVDLVVGAGVDRDEGGALNHLTLTAGLTHAPGRLAYGIRLAYTLNLAPPGLDFLERSLLYGAVSMSWNPPG